MSTQISAASASSERLFCKRSKNVQQHSIINRSHSVSQRSVTNQPASSRRRRRLTKGSPPLTRARVRTHIEHLYRFSWPRSRRHTCCCCWLLLLHAPFETHSRTPVLVELHSAYFRCKSGMTNCTNFSVSVCVTRGFAPPTRVALC